MRFRLSSTLKRPKNADENGGFRKVLKLEPRRFENAFFLVWIGENSAFARFGVDERRKHIKKIFFSSWDWNALVYLDRWKQTENAKYYFVLVKAKTRFIFLKKTY